MAFFALNEAPPSWPHRTPRVAALFFTKKSTPPSPRRTCPTSPRRTRLFPPDPPERRRPRTKPRAACPIIHFSLPIYRRSAHFAACHRIRTSPGEAKKVLSPKPIMCRLPFARKYSPHEIGRIAPFSSPPRSV